MANDSQGSKSGLPAFLDALNPDSSFVASEDATILRERHGLKERQQKRYRHRLISLSGA
jgi:hypothetical protein